MARTGLPSPPGSPENGEAPAGMPYAAEDAVGNGAGVGVGLGEGDGVGVTLVAIGAASPPEHAASRAAPTTAINTMTGRAVEERRGTRPRYVGWG